MRGGGGEVVPSGDGIWGGCRNPAMLHRCGVSSEVAAMQGIRRVLVELGLGGSASQEVDAMACESGKEGWGKRRCGVVDHAKQEGCEKNVGGSNTRTCVTCWLGG
jgi:hypothetical protein